MSRRMHESIIAGFGCILLISTQISSYICVYDRILPFVSIFSYADTTERWISFADITEQWTKWNVSVVPKYPHADKTER